MEMLASSFQVIIAIGIFNVWFVRLNQATEYRGGDAKNMEEEFKVYGFSRFFMRAIGVAKVLLAVALLVGLWSPPVARTAAIGMGALMLGAIAMHIKVHDPLRKSLPALMMFLMSAAVALLVAPVPS